MNWRIEIRHKKGVFDSLGESIEKAIVDLGISTVSKVEVAQIYNISGSLLRSQIEAICNELLVDKITQQYECADRQKLAHQKTLSGENIIEIAYNPGVMDPVEHSTMKGIIDLGTLDILGASDDKLMRLSQEGQLFLNLNEMKAIQKYFKKLKRNPTDCELETVAQTWSEHCYHKTFRGNIKYQYTVNGVKKTKIIKNLLKSTIIKATTEINKPWCVSVFHDNAGVIRFDEDSNICFKAETHNHPSALEPFGGANTGLGGVIRDVLGAGLGAKTIGKTDVFCFANYDYP